jgi:adenine deaminase
LNIQDLLAVARGDSPADLVLRNARLVNVFSGAVEETDIALYGEHVAGLGPGYSGQRTVDLAGAFVTPGLIDAHVHIESSLCIPAEFARAVLPRGVTTVVADPHEIANVAGVAGIRYMAADSRGLPLGVVFMAPSCVPATAMETNGAALTAADLAPLLADGTVYGLAEVMNFPGVVAGDPAVLAKIAAFAGRVIDGHAPALHGQALAAYAAAGIGSEHECTTAAEAAAKLALGFHILIRQATNAANLQALLPAVTPANSRRFSFCTDDRVPSDLLDQGSIDYMVRAAVEFGLDPITAIRMATLNSAEWFRLADRGAVAPGRRADLVICADLANFRPRQVYARGQLVAEDGKLVVEIPPGPPIPQAIRSSVNLGAGLPDLRIPVLASHVRAIGMLPDQLVTEERVVPTQVVDGMAVADPGRDLLKMAVVERHKGGGAVGLGFIQGFGLRCGAIAGTVAHDHHNLVIVGADDDAMTTAAQAVAALGGGLAVAAGKEVLAALPLPVAGLMSDRPVQEVRAGYDALLAAARALGSPLHDPFMAMSFMALEVIPKLKLTDQGLVDVEKFSFVDLFVEPEH